MALEHFDPQLRMNDLVQDLKWNSDLRHRFEKDQEAVLAEYDLTEPERTAIRSKDFRAAFELGLHPYLLSQLARLLYGTGEKAGASEAASALIKSLLGEDYDRYMSEHKV